jgi:hypothetical protein
LIDIDDKLIAMLAGENFVGSGDNGIREVSLEAAGLFVCECSGAFDSDSCFDERGERFDAADGEILNGA